MMWSLAVYSTLGSKGQRVPQLGRYPWQNH
jgi:hypothetical protein